MGLISHCPASFHSRLYSHHLPIHPILDRIFQILHLTQQPDRRKRQSHRANQKCHNQQNCTILRGIGDKHSHAKQSNYHNSLMVAVIDILRIRFAGAYTAAIAAIETNRRITPKEIIGNCHTVDGKCPAIRKSYSDFLSGKPIAQPTNDYDDSACDDVRCVG